MPAEQPRLLTTAEIKAIAKEASTCVLHDHYRLLGYDIDSADDVKALQADFGFLKASRSRLATVGAWIARTVVIVLVSALVGVFFLGRDWKGG